MRQARTGAPTLALAMLIASTVFAQPIQPADAGAYPLRQRIAIIDTELNTLGQHLRSSKMSAQEKAGVRNRLDALAAEKQELETELKDLERRKDSPLVQFHSPAPEAK